MEEFTQRYSEALANPEVIAPKTEIARPDIATLKVWYSNWEEVAVNHYGYILPNSPTVENQEDTLNKVEPRDTVDW